MAIDRIRLIEIFSKLGAALFQPTTLCLIGSSPGIYYKQAGRQTGDVDIWENASDFDLADLVQACQATGILFDPSSEVDAGTPYLQLVAPGIVNLPNGLIVQKISKSGNLRLVMPSPALLAASKLTRAAERDIEDIVWWINARRLDLDEITPAINSLPNVRDREFAGENLVLVRLLAGRKP